jgi:predicted nucleic acid-binding protein
VDPKQELILIDTNIFVIDLRYKRDVNFNKNQDFLVEIAQSGSGFTTLVNLLELCGIFSFNLNAMQLKELWLYFQKRYQVTVLPAPDMKSDFPAIEIARIFSILSEKTSFGDALILAFAEKYLPFVETMVTWDIAHFKNKYRGQVLTPDEFIAA